MAEAARRQSGEQVPQARRDAETGQEQEYEVPTSEWNKAIIRLLREWDTIETQIRLIQDDKAREEIFGEAGREFGKRYRAIKEALQARQEAKGKLLKANDKSKKAVALALIATVGGGAAEFSTNLVGDAQKAVTAAMVEPVGTVERAPEQHKRIPTIEMRDMHPEATNENVLFLLETFPRSLGENVSNISFVRQPGPKIKFGEKESESRAAATATGVRGAGKTTVVFYDGSYRRGDSSKWISIMAHEAGHAGDWERNGQAAPERLKAWKSRGKARIQAPDRLKDNYSEAFEDIDTRAVEVFAVKMEKYLLSANPTEVLPAEDIAQIEDYIRETDPNFDRLEAFERRYGRFGMSAEKLVNGLAEDYGLSQADQEALRASLDHRETVKPEADMRLQRLARADLVRLCADFGTDANRKKLVELALSVAGARESLLQSVSERDSPDVGAVYIERFGEEYRKLFDAAQTADEEGTAFLRSFMKFVAERDVVVGHDNFRFGKLEENEIFDYANPQDIWVVDAAGWVDKIGSMTVSFNNPLDEEAYEDARDRAGLNQPGEVEDSNDHFKAL